MNRHKYAMSSGYGSYYGPSAGADDARKAIRYIADQLGPGVGEIPTTEVAAVCGVKTAKAWKVMRDLELSGDLVGYARDRHGDEVERNPITGRPVRPSEIHWSLSVGEDLYAPIPKEEALRVAQEIVARLMF